MTAADIPALSPDQAAVIELLASGLSLHAVLGELDISQEVFVTWLKAERFAELAEVAGRGDGPNRRAELVVINHELTRARVAARQGLARANALLAGADPSPPADPGPLLAPGQLRRLAELIGDLNKALRRWMQNPRP